MIPLLAPVTVTRRRYGAPTFVDGFVTQAVPVDTTITAALCPSPEADREYLPDGMRAAQRIRLVSYTEIRGASDVAGVLPDVIVAPDGASYQVVRVERGPAFLGQPEHWVALAVQVQPLQYPGAVAVAPSFSAAPSIYGATVTGSILACLPGTVTGSEPITVAYQWQRGGVDVPDEDGQTVTASVAGVWRCVVTATGPGGTATTNSNTITVAAP